MKYIIEVEAVYRRLLQRKRTPRARAVLRACIVATFEGLMKCSAAG